MHSKSGAVATELILAVFRLNGLLVSEGDRIAAPLGLTSARWQVLGAVAMATSPLTVPQIGAAMGMSRQGAQKQIDLLTAGGLIEAMPNPAHQRSPLHRLTRQGKALYARMSVIQAEWVNAVAKHMRPAALRASLKQFEELEHQLEVSAAAT